MYRPAIYPSIFRNVEVLGGDCHVSVENPTDQLKHIHPYLNQVIYPEACPAVGQKGHMTLFKFAPDVIQHSSFFP